MITKKLRLFQPFLFRNLCCGWIFALGLGLGLGGLLAGMEAARADELVRVADVVDGATVALTDGRAIRLDGLVVDSAAAPACAAQEKAALARLALGRDWWLANGGVKPGWNGRLMADLVPAQGGEPLQLALLESGYGRAYSFADRRDMAARFLMAEDKARQKGAGLWAKDANCYRVYEAGDLPKADLQDDFQIVSGKIVKVADTSTGLYLDFADDWRHGFSVLITHDSLRLFRDQKLAPKKWQGAVVRVRGWVFTRMGPLLRVDHPEQIELVSPPPPVPTPPELPPSKQ